MQIEYKKLPKTFGVYIFKDSKKQTLYIGKAINLNARVSSYFNKSILNPKTSVMVSKIAKIDYIIVENELEALLLEASLIKQFKPKYNIVLKDDKFYQYIKIYKQQISKKIILSTITTTRKKDKDGEYFGPYPKVNSIRIILKSLRKVFPYMNCSKAKYKRHAKSKHNCIYGQIGLCKSPCINTEMININNKNVENIAEYLKGNKDKLFIKLEKEMKKLSRKQAYEKAIVIRDQLKSYKYLTQQIKDANEYTQNPNLKETSSKNSLSDLIKILSENGLKLSYKKLASFRIEIYDISNFQGNFAVGSMVVSIGGMQKNEEYKKFRIKTKITPDDFSMMKEILKRRFTNETLLHKMPNLIVVDGGKGQLSVALNTLDKLYINIPIIGLAKRNEEIVLKSNKRFKTLKLKKDQLGLQIIIKGRNEAHRFAINYYRMLHRKVLLGK